LTPPLTAVLASAPGSRQYADFDVPIWAWGAFAALVIALLLLDLLLVHRTAHVISFREAAVESSVWIAIGLCFALVVLWWQGGEAAGEYIAGYLIEKSLSIDNVFVWALLFSFFAVPAEYQFRVLFWGVFGALVLRAMFIFAGVALIERFEWVLYVFGAFLLFTAVRIARHSGVEVHPERNPVLRFVRKVIPSTNDYDGQKLFSRRTGRLLATPLFAVLVLIEATDVVFAVDSVPAILAVSREPFIVFASNAFAILGLRSLYFLLAGMANRFRYLKVGLGVILAFVGLKMLLARFYHVPVSVSLGVIALVLLVAVWASLRAERRSSGPGAGPGTPPPGAGAGHAPHPARPDGPAGPEAGNGVASGDGHRSGGLRDDGLGRPVTGPRSPQRPDG
jgi:TerC family integral membrane protein